MSVSGQERSKRNVVLEIKSRVSPNTVKTAETYKAENGIEEFTDLQVSNSTAQISFPQLKKFVPDPTHVSQVNILKLNLTFYSLTLKMWCSMLIYIFSCVDTRFSTIVCALV